MSANVRISNLPNTTAAAIVDTDIVPIVIGIASGVGVTSKVTIAELRLELGTTAPAGGRTVTSAATYLLNNAVFNVKDFGAVGGTGTIDDTAAFAATMTALNAAGGGVFYMPSGTYKADLPGLVSNCWIRGDGKERTIINALSVNAQWFGSDVSNIRMEQFTFVGKSAGGTATTNMPVWIRAVSASVTNISIVDVAMRDFKSGAMIRITGNGDLVTTATQRASNIEIRRVRLSQLYDIDSTNIGQEAALVYLFGGVDDTDIDANLLDAQYSKQCIFIQTDATRIAITNNHCKNAGLVGNGNGSYAIICYSSYASSSVSQVTITHNRIDYSARAGIYLAAVGTFVVSNNTLRQADANGTGLGTIGSGAIMVNQSSISTDPRPGYGLVSNNVIIDPGVIGVYINIATFALGDVSVIGNALRMTTATASRFAFVVNGRGVVFDGNTMSGFTKNLFIYNAADNDTGDLTFSNNQIDGTLATGSRSGITLNSTTFLLGPIIVNGNRFKMVELAADIRNVSDLILTNNIAVGGVFTTAFIVQAFRALVSGNMADTGTTGLNMICQPATATARIVVQGNSFPSASWTNPILVTENTGQILVSGNDGFGARPGVGGNNGDTSATVVQPSQDIYQWNTTLTANRTVTLSGTKVIRGTKVRIIRNAGVPGAFTLAVINGGPGAGTLYTIPINVNGWVDAEWDGTNWIFAGYATF